VSVGRRIYDLRKELNISQVDLAKIMGITRQAVSKWENDLSAPDTLNLIKLADVLETDVEYLATGRKKLPPSPPPPVRIVEPVEKIVEVEKVIEVEKPVEIIRVVEVEKPVETIVEKNIVRRIIRFKYRRNPVEYVAIGLICFILGLLIGFLF
jgi:transcriptional regulator with XRE-family HTH domain